MTQIGLGHVCMYGYANGMREPIANTVEQICAYIMKHQYESVTITNIMDMLEIETSMGFIFKCTDQEFLRTQLIPALAPMQMGEVEAPEFVPYVEEEGKLIQDVRFSSAAGHSLYTITFEDGYPCPYSRETGYYPSEDVLEKEFPDSLSWSDAIKQAKEKGWIESK